MLFYNTAKQKLLIQIEIKTSHFLDFYSVYSKKIAFYISDRLITRIIFRLSKILHKIGWSNAFNSSKIVGETL